ncbi:hypothetical protein GR254_25140, partial [Mycobacterium tuberculosis]|nr:hypothetical protein [Mycobacterium tuberculosis]
EEGVLFDNWLLAENGRFREAETRRLLTEAPFGSRNPDEEGVLFDNWLLAENGRFREAETRRLLTEAPFG